MTAEEIKAKFPNASAAFIARNARKMEEGFVAKVARSCKAVSEQIEQSLVWNQLELKPKPKPKKQKPLLNKTEQRFFEILRVRHAIETGGDGAKVLPLAYTLRLADRLRYTPDIAVVESLPAYGDYEENNLRITFYEVKGPFIWSKAMSKPKAAAALFPHHRFILAQWKDGKWTETILNP